MLQGIACWYLTVCIEYVIIKRQNIFWHTVTHNQLHHFIACQLTTLLTNLDMARNWNWDVVSGRSCGNLGKIFSRPPVLFAV